MEEVKEWIKGDESAREMLGRQQQKQIPSFVLPPLHRIPLRLGNVVELVGPSPSAKSQLLLYAAVNCILPKEWNGVCYGGLEQLVMFLDLDGGFDILRLSQLLKLRISQASGSRNEDNQHSIANNVLNYDVKKESRIDEKLFASCMRRFLYIRCYDTLEFLATLKTLHHQHQKQREVHGASAHFLIIDSIGAFYWLDRASASLPQEVSSRKLISLQSVWESIVQELQKLLWVHPMLILTSRAIVLANKDVSSGVRSISKECLLPDVLSFKTAKSSPSLPFREYLPPIWQSFVTHRILLAQVSDDLPVDQHIKHSIFLSKWLLPPLNYVDKFAVGNVGIFMVT